VVARRGPRDKSLGLDAVERFRSSEDLLSCSEYVPITRDCPLPPMIASVIDTLPGN
jgi:hypothetical protein